MKPTTFLSIIGVSGLFLIAYFKFNVNKPETGSQSKVTVAVNNTKPSPEIIQEQEKEVEDILITPLPEFKKEPVKTPKSNSKKAGNKPEAIKIVDPKVTRDPDSRKDFANVFWKKSYTLFDLVTDEPIFPIIENGQKIYKIFYSSNEDPNPYYGSFTEEQLERHLFYKFKDIKSCKKFCNSKK
jgi:hypothetical protein